MSARLAVAALVTAAVTVVGCSSDRRNPLEPVQTAQAFFGCSSVQTITVGSTVNGTLSADDCRAPDNSFVDFYELRLTSARTITITMSSAAFDTFLVLFDRDSGDLIGMDDDGGTGTNSRLQMDLQSGTYVIGANSYYAGETGPYQLAVN